ncbi:MAG: hypothetical protein ACXABC_11180, partial [Candidatus Thorarchaeota archaeon]
MTKPGKMDRLGTIVEKVLWSSSGVVSSCVVTNERGLVVAEKTDDSTSSQALAAMISLLSDAANRVNNNLGFGHPKTTSVKTLGATISVYEFQVQNRWFRIGAVLTGEDQRRFQFLRRRIDN